MGRVEDTNNFVLTNFMLLVLNQTTTVQPTTGTSQQSVSGTISFMESPQCQDELFHDSPCLFPSSLTSNVSLRDQREAMERSWRLNIPYRVDFPSERTPVFQNRCRKIIGQQTICQRHNDQYRCHVTQHCRKALAMVAFRTSGSTPHYVSFNGRHLAATGAGPKTVISVGDADHNINNFQIQCFDVRNGVRHDADCSFHQDVVVYTLEYRCTECPQS